MPYCANCGAQLTAGVNFCPKCGAAAPGPAAAPPVTTPPPAQTYYPPPVAPPVEPGYGAVDSSTQLPPEYAAPPAPDYYAMQRMAADREEQLRFINSFTWAPGCLFYFCSRAMLLFLVLALIVKLYDGAVGALTTGETGEHLPAPAVLILSLIDLAAIFGLLVWSGRVARRRRWEQLAWRDYEHFRQDERTWNIVGMVGWGLQCLILTISFIVGFVGGLNGGH